jgi:hypothetical protein
MNAVEKAASSLSAAGVFDGAQLCSLLKLAFVSALRTFGTFGALLRESPSSCAFRFRPGRLNSRSGRHPVPDSSPHPPAAIATIYYAQTN